MTFRYANLRSEELDRLMASYFARQEPDDDGFEEVHEDDKEVAPYTGQVVLPALSERYTGGEAYTFDAPVRSFRLPSGGYARNDVRAARLEASRRDRRNRVSNMRTKP